MELNSLTKNNKKKLELVGALVLEKGKLHLGDIKDKNLDQELQ